MIESKPNPSQETSEKGSKLVKRLFDIVLSMAGLIVLLPVFVIIALLVYFKLGRPILFKQKRPGLRGKPFILYKFRSMTNDCDEHGNLLPSEERLIPFGQALRSSSLDELPELFNVIKGDMSLVGPRPLRMGYLDLYSEEQARRHEVRPGITGWAQIHGRNRVDWQERFRLDVWYVDNQSLWLDIKIIFKTFVTVATREGIDPEDQRVMSRFKGNEKN
jgi:lipopolysaccharide/colanic/teichoic acid biosynthesis glycosyltransferase